MMLKDIILLPESSFLLIFHIFFLSDSATLISSFLTSSSFCPQLIKSQILSLPHTELAALSVHPKKCDFVNFPTDKERHKNLKSASVTEEKEMPKQWEGKQEPWTNAKTVVRAEKDKDEKS